MINPSQHHTTTEFIDHRAVAWNSVRRTRYWLHQRFHYAYPGPIRELRHRLVVVPADQYGDQRLCDFQLRVSAEATSTSDGIDPFGNRVMTIHIPEVADEVSFEVSMSIERQAQAPDLPRLAPAEAAPYLHPTLLTAADDRLAAVARDLAARSASPAELAEAINAWAAEAISYGHGITNVATTAAEALTLGQGLCQDYAHIMLAICRAAHLPARYVSGHMLGEGGSHAWVEVLLPDGDNLVAVPYDPTNHRQAHLGYITIAVGRDYRDVSPTSGSYIAPYQGRLTASKRAGLTRVEYAGG